MNLTSRSPAGKYLLLLLLLRSLCRRIRLCADISAENPHILKQMEGLGGGIRAPDYSARQGRGPRMCIMFACMQFSLCDSQTHPIEILSGLRHASAVYGMPHRASSQSTSFRVSSVMHFINFTAKCDPSCGEAYSYGEKYSSAVVGRGSLLHQRSPPIDVVVVPCSRRLLLSSPLSSF